MCVAEIYIFLNHGKSRCLTDITAFSFGKALIFLLYFLAYQVGSGSIMQYSNISLLADAKVNNHKFRICVCVFVCTYHIFSIHAHFKEVKQ